MHFKIAHNNLNVLDLDKSLLFYENALGMKIAREKRAADGSFRLVFLQDAIGGHELELTWLRDRMTSYNLGDNEVHIAFYTDDLEAAHAHHKKMGCICYENPEMGVYFIADPDGYWTEIIPQRR